MDEIAAVIFKSSGKYYFMLNADGSIAAFKTLQKGSEYFTDGYKSNHRRGYEASMSACINYISFTPSVIATTLDKIKLLVGEPPYHPVTIGNVSGRMYGLECVNVPDTEKIFEAGFKPALI